MIWIMLATVVVVFVVGFRVLTSGTRRAIRRLSERLNIDVVPVESMIDQMGKVQGEAFLQYLHRPDESAGAGVRSGRRPCGGPMCEEERRRSGECTGRRGYGACRDRQPDPGGSGHRRDEGSRRSDGCKPERDRIGRSGRKPCRTRGCEAAVRLALRAAEDISAAHFK